MKQVLLTMTFCLLAAVSWSQQMWSTNLTLNAQIPDNDVNGFADTFSVSGLSDSINNVTVNLNITGGFNGDVYAYLTGPNGGFAVLLNRPGLSSGDPNGYSDAGFDITLSDGAANGNIHYYQNVLNPDGSQLTGTWAPDGRNIDPQSAGAVFDGATPTATLSSFAGTDGNGAWAFYVADLSPGGQSTLVNFGVTITTVPEPQVNSLISIAALFLIFQIWNRLQKQSSN